MPISSWGNFYVIVGSSAGALIGLQFVAISLLTDIPVREGSAQAGNAFATPNIVHFCAVLFLAALMSAPWQSMPPVVVQWGLLGVAGFVYAAIVTRRMRSQGAYKPELEDWIFHSILPAIAYAVFAIAACAEHAYSSASLFAGAGASLLLLFIGIHNTWDAVMYHVFVVRRKQQEAKRSKSEGTDPQGAA